MKKCRWSLAFYDSLIFLIINMLFLILYKNTVHISIKRLVLQIILDYICLFGFRFLGKVYNLIWRYGGIQSYIRLIIVDSSSIFICLLMSKVLSFGTMEITMRGFILTISLLCSLTMRMVYRYAYKYGEKSSHLGRLLLLLIYVFTGQNIQDGEEESVEKTRIAVIGAGNIGVLLVDGLLNNEASTHEPVCFVDTNPLKTGRMIRGIPVYMEDEKIFLLLKQKKVKEVVIALPSAEGDKKYEIYNRYKSGGYKVKIYEYPILRLAGGKRQMRDFEIEDLLFRDSIFMLNEETNAYYHDKIILVTGGGGSIGSEICRQLASMEPKQIIILDIYENGAYDIQQELRIAFPGLDVHIEVVSITNREGLFRVFEEYHPEIVINAAAHKHVPLMEKNCIEAVENNIFGTLNIIQSCEIYGTERFIMVSTDKAVNPTNIMGATKRMCEMIMQTYSTRNKVKCSATRFGNVLGSSGSVIPLFRRQIANGGPVTVTDKRIIRYFMTIPEASQLVLQSGAMAKNGQLFVLDMGKPVKIFELAENMIHLSGFIPHQDIEIIETGLRPGEKLYEELLIKEEKLTKTPNRMIFIEEDKPISITELEEKLSLLSEACSQNDDEVRKAMKIVVPTYRSADEINVQFLKEA